MRLTCPDIARACDLARTFHDLHQHRCVQQLLEWVREAEHDAPARSSPSRRTSASAPSPPASPSLWSSDIIEGHVNRIKTIKRAMHGRTSIRRLRTRVLLQA
ncbi:hypothetical protein AB0E08_13675 [Streptomyces sp. NPDC048281]|uniref:hypothetical protein n=1 Tax=Streptomyces sp. NPDC048281 TaxID=3154715 RepID=UPI00342E7654